VARERRPLRALVLVMVAAGCAAMFALMFSRAGDRQPVLVVARTVPAGVAIAPEDLTVLRISADDLIPS
jgi:flagella basal body P-ring formation protein FlgA